MDSKEKTLALTESTTLLLTDKENKVGLITPADAWTKGTNIQVALKTHPAVCRGWIMSEVGRLCKDIDATKTLSSDEEMRFTCRAIIEEHPTITLEEIKVCFDMIRMGKFGKLYGRLKSAEILECLRRYEGEVRTDIMEAKRQAEKDEYRKYTEQKLEPLNLAQLVKDSPKAKGKGIGSRLRDHLDAYAEYDPTLAETQKTN